MERSGHADMETETAPDRVTFTLTLTNSSPPPPPPPPPPPTHPKALGSNLPTHMRKTFSAYFVPQPLETSLVGFFFN